MMFGLERCSKGMLNRPMVGVLVGVGVMLLSTRGMVDTLAMLLLLLLLLLPPSDVGDGFFCVVANDDDDDDNDDEDDDTSNGDVFR